MIFEPTVSMPVVRGLLDVASKLGASRGELMHAAGLRADSTARVKQSDFFRLIDRVITTGSDPAIGLHWIERLMERSFGPIAHAQVYSGTLRQGFEMLKLYEPLIFAGQSAYELIERSEVFVVRKVGWDSHSQNARRFAEEALTSGFLKLVRVYFAAAPVLSVAFTHAAPPHAAEYEKTFGQVVRFEQPFCELELERTLLDAPSPHADPSMFMAQKRIAEQRMLDEVQNASYVVRLRQLLREKLPERIAMEECARSLGLSERSLRKELAAEGASFREVEHAVLGEIAQELLHDRQRTIQETAYEMGFSDAATFHRAFKRWTGMTPSAMRERS